MVKNEGFFEILSKTALRILGTAEKIDIKMEQL